MSRFKLALQSQNACNVTGLANSLVDFAMQVRDEGGQPSDDPAIALVAYQIAYLCKVGEFHITAERYAKLTEECEVRQEEEA